MKYSLCGAIFLICLTGAALELAPVFSSGMVLQQEMPVSFWGTARPGEKIEADFNGSKQTCTTAADGKWQVTFPAVKAGYKPLTLSVTGKDKSIVLSDMLAGEVWFCSGQSNMRMMIGKRYRKGWAALNAAEEVRNANYPGLRYAQQTGTISHNVCLPAEMMKNAAWVKSGPAIAHIFSATAYFFGRELHKSLNVPVGLIVSAYGGTKIETWISEEGYKKAGLQKELNTLKKFRFTQEEKEQYEAKEKKRFQQEMKAWHDLFREACRSEMEKNRENSNVSLDDSQWDRSQRPQCFWEAQSRWFRLKFSLPANMAGKKVVLKFGKIGEAADIYLNGKKIHSYKPDSPEEKKSGTVEIPVELWSKSGENLLAVRGEYYHIYRSRDEMYNLMRGISLVVGKQQFRLSNKGWRQLLEYRAPSRKIAGKMAPEFMNFPYKDRNFPSNLYNGMVDGWTKLPVRGVIWYQGCSNVGGKGYEKLLETLIADWRSKWQRPDLPFVIIQLAGYDPILGNNWQKGDPNKVYGNALIREIQQKMLKLPNVGLVTAIDIGEADQIHPGNKQEVGKRLSNEVQSMVYDRKVASRGPLFAKAVRENDRMRVFFLNAGGGLKTSDNKSPGAFAIAGADKKFVWAKAVIEGDTVVVSSPEISEPVYVRYAFAGYRGDCNLQNKEGLPAFPFRSDK
ncbi:MAG: hypothetical protein IJW17_02850 [Lentisphaeria bacterium]|nr:hypothetical protein [Lentisphaeria bacterium]